MGSFRTNQVHSKYRMDQSDSSIKKPGLVKAGLTVSAKTVLLYCIVLSNIASLPRPQDFSYMTSNQHYWVTISKLGDVEEMINTSMIIDLTTLQKADATHQIFF